MPYIGTPPSDRIITSEDIEAGAVEMSDISWKNQSTNENLSGTIDSFTVKLAEKFTLTGDIAISKDLTLTKLADDGEALVLTTDASSRTIEGSGTISSNTFAQVPNASLTSMTGVLGSGVTGGSGINALGTVASGTIGSGVTFPTGMMIQITENAYTAVANRTSTSLGAFSEYAVRGTISNCQSTSKIFISTNVCANGTNDLIAMFALYDVTNSQYVSNMGGDGHFGCSIDENGRGRSLTFQTLYTPPAYSSNSLTIELYAKGSSSGVRINQRGHGDAYGRGTTNIILQEIAG